MSPGFERRLARIDKAFDRIRAAREAEEGRLGLAEFYLKLAMFREVMETHGLEAAEWMLGGPEPSLVHHGDTENTEPRAA